MTTRAPRGTIVTEPFPQSDRAGYMRAYRASRTEVAVRNRLKVEARRVAALQVAKAHPDEFAAAIAHEEHKRGL